jgi:hypothetical protein
MLVAGNKRIASVTGRVAIEDVVTYRSRAMRSSIARLAGGTPLVPRGKTALRQHFDWLRRLGAKQVGSEFEGSLGAIMRDCD